MSLLFAPPWKSGPDPAAKRRQNAAHGVSRGWCCEEGKSPGGRQKLAQAPPEPDNFRSLQLERAV